MSPIQKTVRSLMFGCVGFSTLFLGTGCINGNSSKSHTTLQEQATGLTREINMNGLTLDLDRRASKVEQAVSTKHRRSNDSFYTPSPHETMALLELKQAVNQAKR